MPLAVSAPPLTPAEPVTEILHGVEITDPYRWLENQHSPRTRKWIQEQTAYARAYLSRIPGRERIRKRIEELLAVEVISEPWKASSRFFFLKRAPYKEQPAIMMREHKLGADIPLIDPAERGEGAATAVDILNISTDGKLLAYSVRRGGSESHAVEFFAVDTREVLPDRLPEGWCGGIAFHPDGKGVYYSHVALDALRPHYRAVYSHTFGTEMSHDFEVFVAGEAEQLQLYVLASPDSRRLIYPLIWLHDPPFTDLYLHDPSTGKPPQRIVEKMEGMFCPYFFLERQLITLTDWRAPNGRVLAIDMDSPHPNNWRDLVPESRSPIQGIAVVGARIFVRYIEKLQTRIEIFDQLGRRQGILPCQSDSTARFLGGRPESDTLFYEVTSFSRPPSIVTYHTTSGKQEIWANQEVPFDSSSVEVNQVSYPSKDGTQIPMFLICQKERGSRQLPTFLTGYGGFGASITPQFAAYAAFLIEHGFLFAVANLRGGAEFGRQWHLAGRRHNRQNAIDDFIAAAEWLLSTGHTDLEGLAIGGGSNAGLLVGAALTQRPDLFRAVICLGPLLDMLRYHKFDMAQRWVEEFGSTDDPDDFRALRAYSPYHNVRAGIAYPAAMLITGDADSRCNPMHARKMTAALQAATSSQRTVLLDYRRTWGHVAVQPLTARIEALTDRLAFICQELGVTV